MIRLTDHSLLLPNMYNFHPLFIHFPIAHLKPILAEQYPSSPIDHPHFSSSRSEREKYKKEHKSHPFAANRRVCMLCGRRNEKMVSLKKSNYKYWRSYVVERGRGYITEAKKN